MIEAEKKAMGYLIGEKFLNFLERAETDRTWREAIPRFVAGIKVLFERPPFAMPTAAWSGTHFAVSRTSLSWRSKTRKASEPFPHLHQFKIESKAYGDPDLLFDDVDPMEFEDSTSIKISEKLPRSGKRL